MKFEKELMYTKTGKIIGLIIGYFIFATFLYFVLHITKKLPQNLNYLHIALISLSIVLFGELIGRLLK